MSIPAGLPPPRPDQVFSDPGAPMAPGAQSQTVKARIVIVSGPGEGVYSYSSKPPAAGTLIATAGIAAAGFDPLNVNAILPGNTTYNCTTSPCIATSMNAGFISYYTASSYAGPWNFYGELEISLTEAGVLVLAFTSISGAINTPQTAALASYPYPADPFTGGSWGSGERADYVNDLRADTNTLDAALQASGVVNL